MGAVDTDGVMKNGCEEVSNVKTTTATSICITVSTVWRHF